jgi:hypothetical protein
MIEADNAEDAEKVHRYLAYCFYKKWEMLYQQDYGPFGDERNAGESNKQLCLEGHLKVMVHNKNAN